jgi:hypothetical protein
LRRRRTFLAKIGAHPAVVARGYQEALRRPPMENEVEGGWPEKGCGNEDGKAKNCEKN